MKISMKNLRLHGMRIRGFREKDRISKRPEGRFLYGGGLKRGGFRWNRVTAGKRL